MSYKASRIIGGAFLSLWVLPFYSHADELAPKKLQHGEMTSYAYDDDSQTFAGIVIEPDHNSLVYYNQGVAIQRVQVPQNSEICAVNGMDAAIIKYARTTPSNECVLAKVSEDSLSELNAVRLKNERTYCGCNAYLADSARRETITFYGISPSGKVAEVVSNGSTHILNIYYNGQKTSRELPLLKKQRVESLSLSDEGAVILIGDIRKPSFSSKELGQLRLSDNSYTQISGLGSIFRPFGKGKSSGAYITKVSDIFGEKISVVFERLIDFSNPNDIKYSFDGFIYDPKTGLAIREDRGKEFGYLVSVDARKRALSSSSSPFCSVAKTEQRIPRFEEIAYVSIDGDVYSRSNYYSIVRKGPSDPFCARASISVEGNCNRYFTNNVFIDSRFSMLGKDRGVAPREGKNPERVQCMFKGKWADASGKPIKNRSFRIKDQFGRRITVRTNSRGVARFSLQVDPNQAYGPVIKGPLEDRKFKMLEHYAWAQYSL